MLKRVLRSVLALGLIGGMSNLAVAQYGGGMGGGNMPGTPGYNANRSYSNKGAIIGGVVAGAAAVGGLLYWRHHKHAKEQASVNNKLGSEKVNHMHSLMNVPTGPVKSGEWAPWVGKKVTDGAGEPTFELYKTNKDPSSRTTSTAENR